MDIPSPANGKLIGQPVRRREDFRLLTGTGRYTDDVPVDDALHVAFVRADAVGRIVRIDKPDTPEEAGAVAIVDGQDIDGTDHLTVNAVLSDAAPTHFPILADSDCLAVGQPVAAILAETRQAAQDAVDTVFVELEDRPDGPVFDTNPTNLGASATWSSGNFDRASKSAAHIVEATVRHPRLAPSALEPRAIAVKYHDPEDRVTVWLSTQTPHRARTEFAKILRIDENRIRVVSGDVGGAFGLKASIYPEEVFAVWAAFKLKCSIRWTASRSEEFLSATHGRGATSRGKLAVAADGRFLGLSAQIDCPLGHWLPTSAAVPAWNAGRILPGPYDISTLNVETRAILSTTAPVGIYRGAGRPEAAALMERLVDCAARATGLDPIDIRRRNLLPPDALPHEGPTGRLLDSGNYPDVLNTLIQTADYPKLRQDVDDRRRNGETVGIGIAFYVEPCGQGWESARVHREPNGRIVAEVGASSQGHGRETAFAQILADRFGIPMDWVTVRFGDTDSAPRGIGALASRSTAIGGSALAKAADEVLARLKNANEANTITAEAKYEVAGEAWGYGVYLAILSIDPDTGTPTIERMICVDDAGTIINPMMVEGQIRGGIAQGIGEALLERVVYSQDGQLMTGSFSDYALPRADDMPPIEIAKTETPSPANLIGAKGVGEAGTIGAPAAILNAAMDALRDYGVTDLPMPLTSEILWRAMHDRLERQDL